IELRYKDEGREMILTPKGEFYKEIVEELIK
ncbi:tRNA (adenosine(37)-N6)-threonylcarbamoyltransferase complex ATPase subunit type 1 TsaE, partial [Clostridioides difficile]